MGISVEAPVLVVRKSQSEDVESLTQLMRELKYPTTLNVMREQMELIAHDPMYCTFVAELDGKVVGMISLRHITSRVLPDSTAQITSLVIFEPQRRMGIGKRLIAQAEAWAAERGCSELFVASRSSREKNSPAYAFYERVGFEFNRYRFIKTMK
ncbi:GNAT family N-acetyltransferase [Paenibacillus sediminis]|uniref:Ribosomal protein S18 acetylase RimI-like enzyme n=1 Tax=Paenibacillus sediminis TaxID=664909 RepID=A0ABS4GZY8_9BACL|nr:GNAT family N-acetyltransferase [Paenibacillus sediminis]MBP1935840.1 ribosomal protein S18 acetylase RimI-like enzyme [Paenibacillus sediminis]